MGVFFGQIHDKNDVLAYDVDDDSSIADEYLKRRGWKESVANKRYMMALRSSVMSLYEVSDIVRDQSFLARDLLRGGEPVRISEKSATHTLKQWDGSPPASCGWGRGSKWPAAHWRSGMSLARYSVRNSPR